MMGNSLYKPSSPLSQKDLLPLSTESEIKMYTNIHGPLNFIIVKNIGGKSELEGTK